MEADFHQTYQVKNLDKELKRRTWYWFQARLYGLLWLPPQTAVGYGVTVVTQRTRLAHMLLPERVVSASS